MTYEYIDAVRRINEKVKPILSGDNNEKVIETDASEVGAESLNINRYIIERKMVSSMSRVE